MFFSLWDFEIPKLQWFEKRDFKLERYYDEFIEFGLAWRKRVNLWCTPWLMLPPVCVGGDRVYKFYSIDEDIVVSLKNRGFGCGELEGKYVGSSYGWVALFNERNKHVFLSDPVVGCQIKLPAIDAMKDKDGHRVVGGGGVSKVILSSPAHLSCCLAMMSFDGGAKLGVCRPLYSAHWTLLCDNITMFHDFVYSTTKQRFISLADGRLVGWGGLEDWYDDGEPLTLKLESFNDQGQGHRCYLVSGYCNAKRYLVLHYIRDDDKTIAFLVYETDNCKQELVASLDGQSIFIGLNHSFVLTVSQFPDLKPDSIYFAGHNDIGIYDYKTGTFLNLDYPDHLGQGIMWFTPTNYYGSFLYEDL